MCGGNAASRDTIGRTANEAALWLGWADMELAVALMAVATVVSAGLAVLYERELRRFGRFLENREQDSNERLRTDLSTRGTRQTAAAVNALLDRRRDERTAQLLQARSFQEGLVSLSHDIRTPLTGAQGYVQLCERTPDDAARRHYLVQAGNCLASMRSLTDQLFEYTKAADPDCRIAVETLAVCPIVASVLARAYPELQARGWHPAVDFSNEDTTVRANAEALERVFQNLLENALRHGVEAPTIRQRETTITFANRIANPASLDPERIFERFYRADAARSGNGSGLGMAVVERLCAHMGARVGATLVGDVLSVEVELQPAAAR